MLPFYVKALSVAAASFDQLFCHTSWMHWKHRKSEKKRAKNNVFDVIAFAEIFFLFEIFFYSIAIAPAMHVASNDERKLQTAQTIDNGRFSWLFSHFFFWVFHCGNGMCDGSMGDYAPMARRPLCRKHMQCQPALCSMAFSNWSHAKCAHEIRLFKVKLKAH